MAEDDKDSNGQEMTEDEKLAAEWEQAMEESGGGGEDSPAEGADDDGGEREDEWAAAMAEAGGEADHGGNGESADVRAAPMQDFTGEPEPDSDHNPDLDVILDIPVTISMEVGNTSIPIRNLLQLNQGSVIELDRLAGEPLDVLVNGMLIAHGEVVMVNEKFGIRLTDVISPNERIRKLSK